MDPIGPVPHRGEQASVLVVVLWVCIGLITIGMYFANSMTNELRASDYRVNGIAAEQAIEGATRYVGFILLHFATNGAVPDASKFKCAAVPVGQARFWLIGRNPAESGSSAPFFGLVDEGGKLSLNNSSTNTLQFLPGVDPDFADAIMDWRGTNGAVSLDYNALGYFPKNAPFETLDELRLVYGSSPGQLAGEDINRNGILDRNEKDLNSDGILDSGLLEYVTVYTREPNFHADGSPLTNVNTLTQNQFRSLFQSAGTANATRMAESIYRSIHPRPGVVNNCAGILDFALRCKNAGMNTDDFDRLAPGITTTGDAYIRGRLNVNTAGYEVLAAQFMGSGVDESTADSAAQTLINYRRQNPDNLHSVAWIIDALGNNNPVIASLSRRDLVTTRTYQFTADIAAVGAFGRGYRRVKFVFDVSDGEPKILYRQDLSRLGWALGEKTREDLIAKNVE